MKQAVCRIWWLSLVVPSVHAAKFPLPIEGSNLAGKVQRHVVQDGETFALTAKQYDVGFLSLMAANKGYDPFLPPEGSVLTIPAHFILPAAPREGIVINLPELRLYYYPKGQDVVHVFPVGIGRELVGIHQR
jgi:L,D-transpeptidase YcfS